MGEPASGILGAAAKENTPADNFWNLGLDGQKRQSNDVQVNAIRSCQMMDAFIGMLQKHNTSSRMLPLRTRVDLYMLQRSKNDDRRPPSRSSAGASMFVIYILSKIRTYKLYR